MKTSANSLFSHHPLISATREVSSRHGALFLKLSLPSAISTPRLNHRSYYISAQVSATSAIPDASLEVKFGLAQSTGRLDLSECNLASIPQEVFEISGLEDLSLAGNEINFLPPEIGKLTSLRRLQLSGNQLRTLPEELGELQALEGLWLHGNRLKELPSSLSSLVNLVQLSVAGNELEALPEGIGALKSLRELAAAGNKIRSLPSDLDGLVALEILGLFGNLISALPESLAGMVALRELWLQGNPPLTILPSYISELPALQQLSAADCALRDVPEALKNMPALRTLSLYGNNLKSIPPQILEAPKLTTLWLEGNPLESSEVNALLAAVANAGEGSSTTIGFDSQQTSQIDFALLSSAGSRIKISEICGDGPGYFKLERAPGSNLGSPPAKVLVVAFGSAPGVPNWGGVLKRVRDAAKEPVHNDFDVLYVVDPSRGWYGGGDDVEYNNYASRLARVTKNYEKVVMIGDSMGATASLLFAGQATSVHAFCPQIDLSSSSIRPGKGAEWGAALRKRSLDGVEHCKGKVTVHVGNWKHDLDQANLLPKDAAHVQIYSVDSHRLAIALDRGGKLLPTLRAAILNEMGLSGNNVRVANLF